MHVLDEGIALVNLRPHQGICTTPYGHNGMEPTGDGSTLEYQSLRHRSTTRNCDVFEYCIHYSSNIHHHRRAHPWNGAHRRFLLFSVVTCLSAMRTLDMTFVQAIKIYRVIFQGWDVCVGIRNCFKEIPVRAQLDDDWGLFCAWQHNCFLFISVSHCHCHWLCSRDDKEVESKGSSCVYLVCSIYCFCCFVLLFTCPSILSWFLFFSCFVGLYSFSLLNMLRYTTTVSPIRHLRCAQGSEGSG